MIEKFLKIAMANGCCPTNVNRNCSLEYKLSPYTKEHTNYYASKRQRLRGQKIIVGYSNNQYWIRVINGMHCIPLHYNKKTHKYGFETAQETFDYFISYYNKRLNQK